MDTEGHYIEYKDFHEDKNLNKKRVLEKLFREISAFAMARIFRENAKQGNGTSVSRVFRLSK